MNPVQSQSLGAYVLASPGPAGAAAAAGQPANGSALSLSAPASADGIDGGWPLRPLPGPIVGGPSPYPTGEASTSQPDPTTGGTGNSFLDLINKLVSQLDSVITGLGASSGTGTGTGSTQPPACTALPGQNPGTLTDPGSLPDPGSGPMQRFSQAVEA